MNIVALGGGNQEAARDSKKSAIGALLDQLDDPAVLIIPSACSTVKSYNRKVPSTVEFFTKLGISAQVLHEFGQTPSADCVEDQIAKAGLIHVIGGNTPHMLSLLKAHKSGQAIRQAVASGESALSGASAGALLGFRTGQTVPVPKPAEQYWEFEYIEGLGLVQAAVAVHANMHDPHPDGPRKVTRGEAFRDDFPAGESTGFAIDEGAALSILGSVSVVTRGSSEANVRICERDPEGIIFSRIFEPGENVSQLLAA